MVSSFLCDNETQCIICKQLLHYTNVHRLVSFQATNMTSKISTKKKTIQTT